MTFPLATDTLASLEEFALAWRFTGPRNALPDAGTRARLRPLSSAGAASIAGEAARRCRDTVGRPTSFRSDDVPGAVRRQLHDLPIGAASSVVLSWNPTTALLTDWETFVSHWEDFCYPASDDVTIWPAAGEWTLCYRHYEVFQFWAVSPLCDAMPTERRVP